MDNKKPNIKERVLQVAKYYNISYESFSTKIGMSYSSFKGPQKNTPINSNALDILLSLFPNVSAEWLLTGKGEMLKKIPENEVGGVVVHDNSETAPAKMPIPLYDINRTTSLRTLFTNKPVPVDSIYIPNLPKCDGAVAMRGDWMAPLINGGDLVLYKEVRVPASREGIMDGSIYLLSFEIEEEEHIVVRYIYSTENDSIKLVGFNKTKPDKIIPINSIKAMALVKASVRYEAIA